MRHCFHRYATLKASSLFFLIVLAGYRQSVVTETELDLRATTRVQVSSENPGKPLNFEKKILESKFLKIIQGPRNFLSSRLSA